MARVAVDVVIKPEILDPQGKAILAALARLGHAGISSVRQGKHFELEVDESVSDADLETIAAEVLANPVIENWTVTRLSEGDSAHGGRRQPDSGEEGESQARSEERAQGRGSDRPRSRVEDDAEVSQ